MPAHNPRGEPREASAAVYDSAADTLSSLQVPIVGSTPLTSLTPAVSGEIRLSTDDMISILPLTQSTTQRPAEGGARKHHKDPSLDCVCWACKLKLKHMHKQYTAYRVAQEVTGNTTERPLQEPLCYEAMCDVWGDLEGMDTDAFFFLATSLSLML
ncbi:hypothetical protein PC116_g25275 [Phytophthora cactorum]|uniref:Uncharacterized protein n=1 Tax=Phytophthora cactorum TaxID=29920 RepID=A0A8T1F2K7_9STRA|nr:hypothetical protein PC112_g17036 [Phytophthora cactorum]KAG2816468.1 hypothetical protein PC111_g13139 [Phytophthora cactorum]KAG2877829.1 hypothetical protein PC114_g23435 [Phytophthora cactorum]KAG2885938.1 hypothetical protein PC115_g20836 [Phytophthora cactorum]KAG2904948.1 hypothetical protein PC117_g20873 [Phytophthora cactorum]